MDTEKLLTLLAKTSLQLFEKGDIDNNSANTNTVQYTVTKVEEENIGNNINNITNTNTKKKNRCSKDSCNKKLTLSTSIECKCKLQFCTEHKYSFLHDCKYDHKGEERKKISQQNLPVIGDKLNKI